jgi:hypothetical protein
MSNDVFRPWATRAYLLCRSQPEGGPSKWHLWLWPQPGSPVEGEIVGPAEPTVVYSEGDVGAIAFYRRLLEVAYDVRDVPDVDDTDRPREPNSELKVVWDLAPPRAP